VLSLQSTTATATHLPRTLIADDEPDILAALQLLLKTEGYQSETVTSPDAVLEAITRSQFDVVLMDLNYARDTTSGREGLDLITRIQALDPTLSIIAMTAWSNVDLAVEAMRRGVRDFVQKPWENHRLLQTLRKQVKLARAKRDVQQRIASGKRTDLRLQHELNEMRELQENLLSTTLPALEGFQFAATWQPVTTVGGDYVAAFNINERHTALCIADVVGKGLPAALLMSNFQAALKSSAMDDYSPSAVCVRLNRLLQKNMPLHKFITGFYGVIDLPERTLSFTNAGHNAPVLIRANGDCIRLETGGSVLGVFEDACYSEDKVALSTGDRLLMFTDGLTEAMNEQGEQFGDERLLSLLREHQYLDAAELKQVVLESVGAFCNYLFQDDATLMVIAVE
jgi:phosphoserine phosphatase RsbU/P